MYICNCVCTAIEEWNRMLLLPLLVKVIEELLLLLSCMGSTKSLHSADLTSLEWQISLSALVNNRAAQCRYYYPLPRCAKMFTCEILHNYASTANLVKYSQCQTIRKWWPLWIWQHKVFKTKVIFWNEWLVLQTITIFVLLHWVCVLFMSNATHIYFSFSVFKVTE